MHLTLVSYIRRRSIGMFEYIAWQVYSEDTTTPDFGTLVFIHERAATRTNTQTDRHIQKSVAGNVMVTVMSFMYSTTECVVLHVIKLRARLLKKSKVRWVSNQLLEACGSILSQVVMTFSTYIYFCVFFNCFKEQTKKMTKTKP